MSVIDVKNVSFSYQETQVLENIGFCVNAGEFVALAGDNGTGKSTLLKLILGELALQSGTINVFGNDIRHFTEWWNVGYVPQDSVALAAGFPANVLEVVELSMYHQTGRFRFPGKKEKQAAMQALEAVGMAKYAKRQIDKLSGGQIQRVMLARVLACNCPLLLLDEPTSGMDAASAQSLYALLKSLCESGITVIMVTHDLVRAGNFVGSILCLDKESAMHMHHPGKAVRCIHHGADCGKEVE